MDSLRARSRRRRVTLWRTRERCSRRRLCRSSGGARGSDIRTGTPSGQSPAPRHISVGTASLLESCVATNTRTLSCSRRSAPLPLDSRGPSPLHLLFPGGLLDGRTAWTTRGMKPLAPARLSQDRVPHARLSTENRSELSAGRWSRRNTPCDPTSGKADHIERLGAPSPRKLAAPPVTLHHSRSRRHMRHARFSNRLAC